MNNTMTLCGVSYKLAPYTEKRMASLEDANALVKTHMDENADQTWEAMSESDKEAFWHRKACILIEGGIDRSIVSNDDFEYGLLSDAESFFIARQGVPDPLPKNTWDTQPIYQVGQPQAPKKGYGYVGSERTDTTHLSLLASILFVPTGYGISRLT